MAEPLICERCGGDNPADARFCIDCGGTLTSATTGPTTRLAGMTCPSCGTNNPEQARFCVLCGRSFSAPQQQPRPAVPPARPSAPRTAPRPAAQSYPRTATPPTLTPFRPPQVRPAHPRHQNPAPFVFLIGLVVLLANHTLWPGILILIGVSILISQVARGRPDKGMNALFWLGGITLLFATGTFWPGIFVLLLLNAAINGRWQRHHW